MLRDDLKIACQCTARATLPLPSPELTLSYGQQLFVRELRGEDLVYIAESKTGLEDRARWAVRALCDEVANRVLNDQDLEWVSGDEGLPTPLLERAYWAAREVTGYTEENRKSFLPPSTGTAGSGSLSS